MVMMGNPDPKHISTSFVERQNLTTRMQIRRFTRLTNAFSKKMENHEATAALHFMNYNYIRIHKTLRVTPAMQAGISGHVWSIEELVSIMPEPNANKRGPYKKEIQTEALPQCPDFVLYWYGIDFLVASPGLEPGLFALRGRRVNQLHHDAKAGTVVLAATCCVYQLRVES